MACCPVRCFLLTACILQLVAVIQRQVLDFLGYLWTPIIVNFIQIIVTILGIFGAYQFKIKYLICYVVLTFLWLGWNVFIICLYFEVGTLTRDTTILNMGTGSKSWWLVNGAGCQPTYNTSHEDPFLFPSPASVEGCLIEYFYIEAIQASAHIVLAVIGLFSACGTIYVYTRDDDSCSVKQIRNLPYSIEFQNNVTTQDLQLANCQRPMTPRKVKQRSTRSKRGSRRRYHQNPVTKLINASAPQNNFSPDSCYPAHSNPSFVPSESGSRPTSVLFVDGRPLFMNNEADTVI